MTRQRVRIVADEGTKEEGYVAASTHAEESEPEPDPEGEDEKLSRRIRLLSSISRCIIRRLKNTWRKSLGRLAKNGATCPRSREKSIYFWQRENEEDAAGDWREEEEEDAFR